jgi:hypothetical protein
MRARGIRSPDDWDAIALTFAEPVHEEVARSPRQRRAAQLDGRLMAESDAYGDDKDDDKAAGKSDWAEVHEEALLENTTGITPASAATLTKPMRI